ncbi:transcriptional regulator, substrate-binding of LysR family protein [Ahrensia sp. R2A130]|nr:transcriptional regulator, substrate-binding of LysR family protein [Ahrensia sp. R2A130]
MRRLLNLKQGVAENAPPEAAPMRHQTTLKFIDAIARAGSIRRAAERMAITPSALNRRLLAVEEEIDAPLFERLATGVRLSAAGELFLAHARRQMADMERIRSQIEDMKGARRGHVSFGFDAGLQMRGFSEAIGMYRGNYPDVTFEVERIDRDDVQRSLSDYRIDLAGVVQPESFPNMTTLAVAPLLISAVVHESHPLASKEQVTFNDLLPCPLVMPPRGSLRDLLDVAARRQDFELRPVLEGELPFAQYEMESGEAVGFAANVSTRREVVWPGMVNIPLSPRDMATPNLHLVQLRGRALSVAASRFADMLVQRFAKYRGDD